MRVIIAEKPSVAREYARVLKARNRRDGYFEREGLCITWAIGHLVELSDPKAYGYEKWNLESLPIIPEKFSLSLSSREGIQKQFQVIRELFEKADEIIVGTDAGREGELIFRYIYEMTGCRAPFKRLWISSQTDKAILEGFRNLRPGTDYDNLFDAARSRSQADWIVGINATRALTLASRSSTVLSLGRVQTPVLSMICSRYLENKNFVPEPYWELFIQMEKEEQAFRAKHVQAFKKEEEALQAREKLTDTAVCTKAETKKQQEKAPLLFDLTSLQQEANKRFGYSAQDTLNTAQNLYEKHKLITYPRTGSRYLSEDLYDSIPELFDTVACRPRFSARAAELKKAPVSRKPFNDKKVTDHHALLPTETSPAAAKLSREEENLYDLIVMRFLAAFSPPCLKEVTRLEFDCGGLLFKASGSVILEPGWRAVEQETSSKNMGDEDEQEEQQSLPKVLKADVLPVLSSEALKKMTRAKPIHNESSLLRLMETAGKELEDDELKEAIKDCGLGTPATRAATIETLVARGYVEREKKKLLPTEKGMQVYELVKDRSIASVEMTGKWEKALNMIAEGSRGYQQFLQAIDTYTRKVVSNLIEIGARYQGEQKSTAPAIEVGLFEEEMIRAGSGKYGTYLLHKEKFYHVKDKAPAEVKLHEAIAIIEEKRKYEAEKEKNLIAQVGKKYQICKGQYGLYVSDGKTNASLPKEVTEEEASAWTAQQCRERISSYKQWKKSKQKA